MFKIDNAQTGVKPFIAKRFAGNISPGKDFSSIIADERASISDSMEREEEERSRMERMHRRIENSYDDAKREASLIIENAREAAHVIMSEATQSADKIKELARQEGYDDGLRAADDELVRRTDELSEVFARLTSEIEKSRLIEYEGIEEELAETAVSIARKVIGEIFEYDEDMFKQLVKSVLEKNRPKKDVTLRLSTGDYDCFFPTEELELPLDDGTVVTAAVLRDSSLNKWDCVLDDGLTVINAGLDTQILKIREAYQTDITTDEFGDE